MDLPVVRPRNVRGSLCLVFYFFGLVTDERTDKVVKPGVSSSLMNGQMSGASAHFTFVWTFHRIKAQWAFIVILLYYCNVLLHLLDCNLFLYIYFEGDDIFLPIYANSLHCDCRRSKSVCRRARLKKPQIFVWWLSSPFFFNNLLKVNNRVTHPHRAKCALL